MTRLSPKRSAGSLSQRIDGWVPIRFRLASKDGALALTVVSGYAPLAARACLEYCPVWQAGALQPQVAGGV